MSAGSEWITVIAFIGGLSAATAMVIVECVALSIMISNESSCPGAASARGEPTGQQRGYRRAVAAHPPRRHLRRHPAARLSLPSLRRARRTLAAIGLLSFAAIAQFAPAFFGGLVWRRATARGAIAGIVAGFVLWAYTLLLPRVADAGGHRLGPDHAARSASPSSTRRRCSTGSTAADARRVVEPSRSTCICSSRLSLRRAPTPIERVQANVFVPTEFTPRRPGVPAAGARP